MTLHGRRAAHAHTHTRPTFARSPPSSQVLHGAHARVPRIGTVDVGGRLQHAQSVALSKLDSLRCVLLSSSLARARSRSSR